MYILYSSYLSTIHFRKRILNTTIYQQLFFFKKTIIYQTTCEMCSMHDLEQTPALSIHSAQRCL